MAKALSHVSLSCLLLLLLLSPLSSAIRNHVMAKSSPLRSFPKTQAQKLIKSFNLSPKHDINNGDVGHVMDESPMMVEKPLRLPVLGDPAGNNSIQDLGHHAGYYRLPNTVDARYVRCSTSSLNPGTITLTTLLLYGSLEAPGCGSELALFYENGPFHIANNLSLLWNEFGWDQFVKENDTSVDQPTGTGFSYSSSANDTRHDENGVSNDLYNFLQGFFKLHPQYVNNDFYITGESYAGHYIPAFASRVHQGNKAKEGIFINLKGFAIGNGLTDPIIQYPAYPDFALDMNLIQQSDYDNIESELVPPCTQAASLCGANGGDSCTNAYEVCNSIFSRILSITEFVAYFCLQYYDIRKQCVGQLCYDFSNMENLLDEQSVRDALGVGDIEYVSCSSTVYDAMITDWMRNLEVGIPALLEDGIKMLAYAGEYDLICNWLGNSNWVHAMAWSGQKDFTAASNVSFVVDGAEKGVMKSYGPLTFLKVHDAGHLVPMDQPKAALEMLRRWTQGSL
ncbi:hypothetical protein RHGRI_036585 [Rhododendron griersonianum]|uniref:Carboxypeptidase n=1 Tax=Rhododendron griersonianum TaxID=479676 RepID=A0AAV6HP06_9ERIC|nr:hypothetical protein RHGRI_036585 [Rhododendron griersonianum]